MTELRIDFTADETAWRATFLELTLEGGLMHERHAGWATDAAAIPPLGDVLASHAGYGERTHVVLRADGAVRVSLGDGWVTCDAAAAECDEADALLAVIRHAIPERPAAGEDAPAAAVSFWALGPRGPVRRERTLDVPPWAEVRSNYAPPTRARLDDLVAARPPLDGGRLVLWHGPPGTGKTNALRALAWEWRDAVTMHYVTDPEHLLTAPGYLQTLLLGARADTWRLVVLEDAGELLVADAGQGMTRLLNLTDGFVGQGLNVLVLITSNDPLETMHPALARPGRCAASVGFERFDAAAAAEWLEAESAATASLAELYAIREGRAPLRRERRLGFVA